MAETEFKLTRAGDVAVAVVTMDGGEDTSAAVLGRAALESLARVLDELESGDWAAMVLTGRNRVFSAGADLRQLTSATRETAIAGSRAGHELFGRLRALPYPTVAAINGDCLGGGVEIALHCDARTISTGVRRFACPEVALGIVPAWGGTQLVPRLVGAEAAVAFVVSNPLRQNRMLDATRAQAQGFADRLVEPAELLDESIAFALELAERPLERGAPLVEDLERTLRRARAAVDDAVHGAAPAPYVALDLLEGALSGWSLERGLRAEEEAVGKLLPGRHAQASLYAFDLVQRRARVRTGAPPVEPLPVRRVGIVGAGLMATQIASLCLRRLEVPVVLRDVEAGIVERALETIRGELSSRVAEGRLDEGRARLLAELVTGGTGYDGFRDCDLVLEAVIERLDVKQQVLAEVEAVVGPACVLATNTSALSVERLSADLARPERLLGMHFFNPVALMPLLELVRTSRTDDVVLATAWDVGRRLGKSSVLVRDAPGFVLNRVLTRMTRVLLDALEHGNTAEEVDEAMLSLGMPMAPSVVLQLVGPRVAGQVLESLHEAFPDRFPLSPALAALAAGEDPPVLAHSPRTQEGIVRDAMEAVADEIHRLLEEGVVSEAADVDTTLLLGAGWPFFMGGATKYLDQTGVSERLFGRLLAETGTRAGI